MRKTKNDTPMTDWTEGQLKALINKENTPVDLVLKATNILHERRDKGYEFLCDFFSPKNKFWTLAKWQLYREGKARVYYEGAKAKFDIEDSSLVFDKMIEIHGKFMKQNKDSKDKTDVRNAVKEMATWKR
jgi:hypothetical protein